MSESQEDSLSEWNLLLLDTIFRQVKHSAVFRTVEDYQKVCDRESNNRFSSLLTSGGNADRAPLDAIPKVLRPSFLQQVASSSESEGVSREALVTAAFSVQELIDEETDLAYSLANALENGPRIKYKRLAQIVTERKLGTLLPDGQAEARTEVRLILLAAFSEG